MKLDAADLAFLDWLIEKAVKTFFRHESSLGRDLVAAPRLI